MVTVELSRNVLRTKSDFYCKQCSVVVYRSKSRQMANVLTTNTGSIHCAICDEYIGKIIYKGSAEHGENKN